MIHLTPQEKIFLICLCLVIATGSVVRLVGKSYRDFLSVIELSDVRPFIRRVNINLASADELMRVPYIGEKSAQKIIQFRKERGRFQRLSELYTIKEISPGFVDKVIPYLKI